MTHDTAKIFWKAYFELVNKNGAKSNIHNPFDDFEEQARKGKYGSPDSYHYYHTKMDTEALLSFWGGEKSETVGNILLNALERTNILPDEIESIADILADASVRTDYCPAELEDTAYDKDPYNEDLDFEPADEPTPFDDEPDWTPREIYDYLNRHVYGQDKAKRAVSMLMYHHLNGNPRNIIIAGASGCGKTEIWRTLSKKFDCIKIVNGAQLSCEGFKGSLHIKDIFLDETEEDAGKLVIVIDEADKMFEPSIGSSNIDFSRKLQNELLKIMDGDALVFVDENNKDKRLIVDCSGISMVFCGSFERMLENKTESSGSIGFGQAEKRESTIAECTEDDLIKYANVRREVAGRISRIVTLDKLDAHDFEAIMDSLASPIRKIEKSHNVSLSVDAKTRKKLAHDAEKSGLGCRYIRSKLQSWLDEQMFDMPDEDTYELCY